MNKFIKFCICVILGCIALFFLMVLLFPVLLWLNGTGPQ